MMHPESAKDFQLSFVYFNVMGNALGMARALHIQNSVWLVGASWGCFVGGVVMSASILIANMRLPTQFLGPASLITLVSFNVAFLIYATLLFVFLPKQQQSPTKSVTQDVETCSADRQGASKSGTGLQVQTSVSVDKQEDVEVCAADCHDV